MAHRSHRHQPIFHGQIHVACTHDATFPRHENAVYLLAACIGGGFHGTYHVVVMHKRQSAARTHVAQNQPSAQYLPSLIDSAFVLNIGIIAF